MHLWGSCRAAWQTQPNLTACHDEPESVMLQYQLWYDMICASIRLMSGFTSYSSCCWREPRTNEKRVLASTEK